MAQAPLEPHTFVFAYRIAVPWLVHVLPFDTTLSFSLIAWLCSGAASAVLFLLLEHLGTPRRISVALALFLAVSPPLLVASLRQGRNPDPLTVAVMVTGALFIAQRRPGPLAATMAVGRSTASRRCFSGPWPTPCGRAARSTGRCCAAPLPPSRPQRRCTRRCAWPSPRSGASRCPATAR